MSNGLVISTEEITPIVIHSDEPNAEMQFDLFSPSEHSPLILLVTDENEVLKYKANFECELDVTFDNDDPEFWKKFQA